MSITTEEDLFPHPTTNAGDDALIKVDPKLDNVWWKLDFYVLPILVMMLFLAFLDRNNIGNARVAGLQKDLRISNREYSTALTLTYIPYILVMIPSNLLLRRIGANIMLPSMTVLWGFTSMMQGEILLTAVVSSLFMKPRIRPLVFGPLGLSLFSGSLRGISLFFAIASFAGAFSGLLAAAISEIRTHNFPGWAWIFILEGIFTVLFGLLSYFILPGSIADAKFLTTDEKEALVNKLTEDGIISNDSRDDSITIRDAMEAFRSPPVFFMSLACFFGGSTESGLAYFEPSIVASLGNYSPNRAQLMSVPPFAAAFFLSFISGYLSDRYQRRGVTCIFFSAMCVAGFSVFLASDSGPVRYGSLFLALPGTYCAAPALGAWTANNSAPYTRRAVALAMLNVMSSAGGILSTWLLGFLSPPPKYTKATIVFIIFSVGELICAVCNLLYCSIQNRRKAIRRQAAVIADEPTGLGDKSAWFIYSL
ncbi:hypothetical protein CVT26_011847 [Gymnopilus dilepis]|uniref:Major facilitator superfamily (MFS) profile domain-containing protein n=1 Tax=Gymnopilus dilepis TaxID=231916 RepID=A0A409WJY9_9AGAR|nr:hypothetical protein CVT26_011847 [Gymnopilus dilepis]